VLIYTAGLYSRNTKGERASLDEIEDNVAHAAKVAARLWIAGHSVICPHTNTHRMADFAPQITSEEWVDGDLVQIARCDAIFMLRGWEISPGAIRELECAEENGLEVYHEDSPVDPILLGIEKERTL